MVLGAALLMQVSGFIYGNGAFLAGVLLIESTFRHQIEADIEPFREFYWGSFSWNVAGFIGREANWQLIVSGVIIAMMFAKSP